MILEPSRFIAFCFGILMVCGLNGPALAASNIGVEEITFDEPDTSATRIVRQMYGSKYRFVRVQRVWLEEEGTGYEALIAKIGVGRKCREECQNIVLFHNETWLEIYRQPAAEQFLLTEIGKNGLKNLVVDGRLWTWERTAYVPRIRKFPEPPRNATEEELEIVNTQLGEDLFLAGNGVGAPPTVEVFEGDIKEGDEKVISVISGYFCGRNLCPVFILNKQGQSYRKITALEGDVGLANERDQNGYRGLEIASPTGVDVVSPSTGNVFKTYKIQKIIQAGTEL